MYNKEVDENIRKSTLCLLPTSHLGVFYIWNSPVWQFMATAWILPILCFFHLLKLCYFKLFPLRIALNLG